MTPRQILVLASILVSLACLAACGHSYGPQGASSAYSFLPIESQNALRPAGLGSNLVAPALRRSGDNVRATPGALDESLLYVSNYNVGTVGMYSLGSGKPVGRLTGFYKPGGLCVDPKQNIYIISSATPSKPGALLEYAHGSKSVLKTLTDSYGNPSGCAVDPKTGDLAVTNYDGPNSTSGNVLVYHDASGTPKVYNIDAIYHFWFAGYDDNDDLYVDGTNASYGVVSVAALLRNHRRLTDITVNQLIEAPGGVQWDGKYMAIGDQSANAIYQFQMSGTTGTLEGTTQLGFSGSGFHDVLDFAITRFTKGVSQGTLLVGGDVPNDQIVYWSYPGGGPPLKVITDKASRVQCVGVSTRRKGA